MTEQKKERSFLITVSVLSFNILHQIVDAVSSVNKLTGDRLDLSLVEKVAVNIADIGNACNNACTVAVTQTSFYVVFFVQLWIYNGIF